MSGKEAGSIVFHKCLQSHMKIMEHLDWVRSSTAGSIKAKDSVSEKGSISAG